MLARIRTPKTRAAKVAVAITSFTLAASAGVALAAFLGSAKMGGSVKSGAFAVAFTSTSATPSASVPASNTACPTATVVDGAFVLTPAATGLFPTESCTYKPSLRLTADRAGHLSALSGALSGTGLRVEMLPPNTATGQYGCGSNVSTTAGTVPVEIRVSVSDDANPGQTWSLSPLAVNALPGNAPTAGIPATACTVVGV